jgi:hypothetical protein
MKLQNFRKSVPVSAFINLERKRIRLGSRGGHTERYQDRRTIAPNALAVRPCHRQKVRKLEFSKCGTHFHTCKVFANIGTCEVLVAESQRVARLNGNHTHAFACIILSQLVQTRTVYLRLRAVITEKGNYKDRARLPIVRTVNNAMCARQTEARIQAPDGKQRRSLRRADYATPKEQRDQK